MKRAVLWLPFLYGSTDGRKPVQMQNAQILIRAGHIRLDLLRHYQKGYQEKRGAGGQAKVIDKYIRYIYNVYTKGGISYEERESR